MLEFVASLLNDESKVSLLDNIFLHDLGESLIRTPAPVGSAKEIYMLRAQLQHGITIHAPRRRAATHSKNGPDCKSLADLRLGWINRHESSSPLEFPLAYRAQLGRLGGSRVGWVLGWVLSINFRATHRMGVRFSVVSTEHR